jgi:hypothetical protein
MEASIAKLGKRGSLVEGDMIRLAALDLVLWIVRARMVGIAFDLELASMHAGRFLEIATFCRQLALLILESRA